MLKEGVVYEVASVIKTHTQPIRKEIIIRTGMFMRETSQMYIFEDFRAKKQNIIRIKEK